MGDSGVVVGGGTPREDSVNGQVTHPECINENVKAAQYAVRGELYLKGEELRLAGREVIFTNIGNPQALGLKPNTFNREVLALVTAPSLLEKPNVGDIFPADAISRAKELLAMIPGGIGAYSDSRGVPGIRKECADFIAARDGHPADSDMIFLSDGASPSVKMVLNTLIRDKSDGILCPIPQYPLYSATTTLLGGTLVPYYLNESKGWSLDLDELKNSLEKARAENISVRAVVIINPGNPTGQCLAKENINEIIEFAKTEKLALMADEVYQDNIYQSEHPFVSFKKALMDMGPPTCNEVELFSFHTISKGYLGECGLRGGYMELTNINPETVAHMYKVASISLCPNLLGQVAMALQVKPPAPSDPSYALWDTEKSYQLDSLQRRAHMMTDAWNSLENVSCNFTEGAMYSFPNITMPPKALEAAKKEGKPADTFYCLKLLESTGISTVPGTGFGQKEGTYHLRTTILPLEEKMPEVIGKLKEFHKGFMETYA